MAEGYNIIKAQFHGIEYVVSWVANGGVLSVDVENDETDSRWHGDFDAQYVEDITHKTGNFKRFDVFNKMFANALQVPTESLFADLLTLQDLELLRSRISTNPTKNANLAASVSAKHSKRYMILTYMTDFDKIHYPLPLPLVTEPDPVALQRTILRLRKELDLASFGGDQNQPINSNTDERVAKLERQNLQLRKRLDEAQKQPYAATHKSSTAGPRPSKQKIDKLQQDRARLEEDLESLTDTLQREREEWNQERSAWRKKFSEYQRLLEEYQSSNGGHAHHPDEALEHQVVELEDAVAEAKQKYSRMLAKKNKDIESLQVDLRRSREANIELRTKLRNAGTSGTTASRRKNTTSSTRRDTVTRKPTRDSSTSRGQNRNGTSRAPSKRRNRTPSANTAGSTRRGRSPSPRFDPTEYQRKREERRQRVEADKERRRSNQMRSATTPRSSSGTRKPRASTSTSRYASSPASRASVRSRSASRDNRDRPWRTHSPSPAPSSRSHRGSATRGRSTAPKRGNNNRAVRSSGYGYRDSGYVSSSSVGSRDSRFSRAGSMASRAGSVASRAGSVASRAGSVASRASSVRSGSSRTSSSKQKRPGQRPRSARSTKSNRGNSGGLPREMQIQKETRTRNARKAALLPDETVDDSVFDESDVEASAVDLIAMTSDASPPIVPPMQVARAADMQVEEIDARLSNLRNFIKAAKAETSK